MKVHIGGDAYSGLVHTVIGSTAKVADMAMFETCLHGEEERACAGRGYDYPRLRDHLADKGIVAWIAVTKRPGHLLSEWLAHLNHAIAFMRACVEHPFRVIKRDFGYTKALHRGFAKNAAQLNTLFALSNLWMARRALITSMGELCP